MRAAGECPCRRHSSLHSLPHSRLPTCQSLIPSSLPDSSYFPSCHSFIPPATHSRLHAFIPPTAGHPFILSSSHPSSHPFSYLHSFIPPLIHSSAVNQCLLCAEPQARCWAPFINKLDPVPTPKTGIQFPGRGGGVRRFLASLF